MGPGHAGLDGNETADRLAGEASAGDQGSAPLDLTRVRAAVTPSRLPHALGVSHPLPAEDRHTLADTGHPPQNQPGSQREVPRVREPDSVAHLLADCPSHEAVRRRRWGVDPSLDDVLGGPAAKIIAFIEDVRRTEPPLDPPAPSP